MTDSVGSAGQKTQTLKQFLYNIYVTQRQSHESVLHKTYNSVDSY